MNKRIDSLIQEWIRLGEESVEKMIFTNHFIYTLIKDLNDSELNETTKMMIRTLLMKYIDKEEV
jgi:hypothetical protein